MNSKKREIKKFIAVFLPFFIITIGLFLSDGLLFIFFTLALWVWFLIMIFYAFILIFRVINQRLGKFLDKRLSNTKLGSKFQISEKNQKRIEKFNRYFLPSVFGCIILLYSLTPHMAIITHWKADQNIPKFRELVDSIIEGKDNNESKAKAILTWFDNKKGNIYNDWRLWNEGHLLFRFDRGQIEIYSTYPYIGVRTYNEEDALWILTSQFGHCGEYSNLFRAMADYAGLRVRKVCTLGENHCWNEVYINDTIRWKIVDPTTVFLDENKNGFDNVNLSWMIKKLGGNVSRVEAKEISGSYYNITNDYTTEVNITVLTVYKDNPMSGVTVKLYSNNREKEGRYTKIKGTTNATGEYTFTIGKGHYTFKCSKDNYYGEESSIFSDEVLNHDIKIDMN